MPPVEHGSRRLIASGDQIALFVKKERGRNLLLMNPLTGAIDRSVPLEVEQELSPTYSPDGKQIAFSGFRGNQPDVFTYDLDTGKALTDSVALAKLLHERGVDATFFMQTKYVRYWNDEAFFRADSLPQLKKLRELGMEVGSHSVHYARAVNGFQLGDGLLDNSKKNLATVQGQNGTELTSAQVAVQNDQTALSDAQKNVNAVQVQIAASQKADATSVANAQTALTCPSPAPTPPFPLSGIVSVVVMATPTSNVQTNQPVTFCAAASSTVNLVAFNFQSDDQTSTLVPVPSPTTATTARPGNAALAPSAAGMP